MQLLHLVCRKDTKLKTWAIIALSVATATIGDTLLTELVNGSDAVAFVFAHLPLIAVIWIVLYTVTTLILTTGSVLADIRTRRVLARENGVLGSYFRLLVFAQYFTGVFALLGLGLYGELIDDLVLFGTQIKIAQPTLAAAVVSALGILGWSLITITESLSAQHNRPQSAEGSELPLLREILYLLRTSARADLQTSGVVMANPAEIIGAFEESQRPMLQVLQELALAVTELRQGIGEIRIELDHHGQTAGVEPLAAFDRAAGELRESVSALTSSTARLDQFITALSAMNPAGDDTATIGARLQVANELRGLLDEMNQKTLEH